MTYGISLYWRTDVCNRMTMSKVRKLAINLGGSLCEISKTRTFITKKTMMDFVFCISLHIVQILYNNIVKYYKCIYIYTKYNIYHIHIHLYKRTQSNKYVSALLQRSGSERGFLILVGSDMGMSYFQLVLHLSGVIGLLSLLELPALKSWKLPHLTSN